MRAKKVGKESERADDNFIKHTIADLAKIYFEWGTGAPPKGRVAKTGDQTRLFDWKNYRNEC